jgi:hypothetical protein
MEAKDKRQSDLPGYPREVGRSQKDERYEQETKEGDKRDALAQRSDTERKEINHMIDSGMERGKTYKSKKVTMNQVMR